MSSLSGRRKRTVIAAIISDPYRKLGAIALAVGLWYFLNNQVARPTDIQMTLLVGQVSGSATNCVTVLLLDEEVVGTRFSDPEGNDIQQVKLTLRGPSSDVTRVEEGLLRLTVSFEHISDWSKHEYVEFQVDDLGPREKLRGLTRTMDPPVVRLDVQKLIKRPFLLDLDNVKLAIDNAAIAKRLDRDTAIFTPATAVITGPQNRVEEFQRQTDKLFLASIEANTTDREASTTIELNAPPSWGLRFERNPTLLIRIETQTQEFKLEVPILIDHIALPEGIGKLYAADGPGHRLVSIKAGGELLQELVGLEGETQLNEWAKKYLRLYLYLPPLDDTAIPEESLVIRAQLTLQGRLSRVDPSDYSLAAPLPITLKKRGQ